MKTPDPIDELLAGGHLPARAYDEILGRVLRATEGRPSRMAWWRRPWLLVPTGALAAALGAWLIFFRAGDGGFATKGGARMAAATGIEIACKSSGGPQCRASDTMMFVVSPSIASGYLRAYAQRADEPGERIWYFPDSTGKSPLVPAGGETIVLEEGVKVGPEHRPGKYRVTLWLAPNPVDRGAPDLVALAPPGTETTVELEILP